MGPLITMIYSLAEELAFAADQLVSGFGNMFNEGPPEQLSILGSVSLLIHGPYEV